MKKRLFTAILLASGIYANAQWQISGNATNSGNYNVGIGTTAPENKDGWGRVLEVKGINHSKIICSSSNVITGIWPHDGVNPTNIKAGRIGTYTNDNLNITTNNTERMTVLTNGNVGVGTTAPTKRLHIHSGAVNDSGLRLENLTAATASTPNAKPIGVDASGNVVTIDAGTGSGGSTAGWGFAGNSLTGTEFLGSANAQPLVFKTQDAERLRITATGNIGIGTQNPDAALTVNGNIHTKEVKIDLNIPVPDYVFEKNYKLMPLQQVAQYVNENKHLPEVPSEAELLKTGLNVSEMNMLLLKKIEELTLYLIEQEKRIKELEKNK